MRREEALRSRVLLVGGKLCSARTGEPLALQTDKDGYLKLAIHVRHLRKTFHFAAHRAIWFLHYGEWPSQTIDHINWIKTDNRIENLRDVSAEENTRHKPTSPTAGVSFHRASGRWTARIWEGKRYHWLGLFDTQEAALSARVEAKSKLAANAPVPANGRVRSPSRARPNLSRQET